jgi:hypothetical protein
VLVAGFHVGDLQVITCQNCGGPQMQEIPQCFYCGAIVKQPEQPLEPSEGHGREVAERVQRACIRVRGQGSLVSRVGQTCVAISDYDFASLLMFLGARSVMIAVNIFSHDFDAVQCFAGGRRVAVVAGKNLRPGDLVI